MGNRHTTACIFCDATGVKLSKEHLLPKWSHSLIPTNASHRTHSTWEHGHPIRAHHTHSVSQGTPMTLRPKVVCASCNNGWMSNLEAEVRLFLSPLIMGAARTLNPTEIAAITRWAVMKSYVAEYLDQGCDVSTREVRNQVRAGQLPPYTHVWLGYNTERETANIWQQFYQGVPRKYLGVRKHLGGTGSERNGVLPLPYIGSAQLCIFAIGHLSILVLTSDWGVVPYGKSSISTDQFLAVLDDWWEPQEIHWPPEPSGEEDWEWQVKCLRDAFNDRTLRPTLKYRPCGVDLFP